MESSYTKMTDGELIGALRQAASIWFKNTDLLLLEELIRRYQRGLNAKPHSAPI
jgi:hypothetical protein